VLHFEFPALGKLAGLRFLGRHQYLHRLEPVKATRSALALFRSFNVWNYAPSSEFCAGRRGSMLRFITIAVFAYVGYRIVKEYVGQIPEDFEPVGLLPLPPLHIEAPRKRKRVKR
jgi:hypothetical protein